MNSQELIDRINYLNSKLMDAHIEGSALYAKLQNAQRQLEELKRELESSKEKLSNVEIKEDSRAAD